MKGVELDSEGWQPMIAGKPDWMSTIALYGTKEGWDALEIKNLSLDEHKALAEASPTPFERSTLSGSSTAARMPKASHPILWAAHRCAAPQK
jgi:hypothetical protein